MADLGFDGKVAIVTGAGGGLGREHALLLASRGALVVVNDIGGAVDGTGGGAGPGQQVVDEIKDAGGEAALDTNSVATPEGGAAIVQSALDAFGRIDIVVNNAGILRDKSFHNMTPDLVDPVLDVHLRGAFYVTQPAWVHMREQSYGRVVVTASSAGLFGNFGQANYGAAKMGLVGLAHVLAQEGERNNIKVNAIAPTAGTRMTREIFGDELADKLAPGPGVAGGCVAGPRGLPGVGAHVLGRGWARRPCVRGRRPGVRADRFAADRRRRARPLRRHRTHGRLHVDAQRHRRAARGREAARVSA